LILTEFNFFANMDYVAFMLIIRRWQYCT